MTLGFIKSASFRWLMVCMFLVTVLWCTCWNRQDNESAGPCEVRFKEEHNADVGGITWRYGIVEGGAIITHGSRFSRPLPDVVVIPAKVDGIAVKSIAGSVFRERDQVDSVSLSEGIESLEFNALVASGVKKIEIPASVTRIDGAMPTGSEWVVSPKNQLYCSVDGALYTKDKKVLLHGTMANETLADALERIADGAFAYCGIRAVSIPVSVTDIGAAAFIGCANLESITLPLGVRKVEAFTFQHCRELIHVDFSPEVMEIGDYAFEGCSKLNKVVIPDGVERIGDYAFANCTGLESVVIPSSVKEIGEHAFAGCNKNLFVDRVVDRHE